MAQFLSTYNPELALGIVERIAEGETLSAICVKGSGMPSRQTFHRWVVRYPELSRAYSAARELSAHSLEEEALDTARQLKGPDRKKLTPTEVRALDVAMNQLRWSASRRNPKVYSERGAISITVPIQINTSMDLGAGGNLADVYKVNARVELPQEPEQIDHGAEMKREGVRPLLPMSRSQDMIERKKQEQEADNARSSAGASTL